MSEPTPPTAPPPVPGPDDPPPADVPAPRPPGGASRPRRVWRWTRWLSALVVAVTAALFVTFFTVDLGRVEIGGQSLVTLAEQYASQFLERPMHIGRISARIRPGEFVLEDVVIEGRSPGDRPFLRAERIAVHVPWWTMFRNRIELDVRMTGWRMVIETWDGGAHNMPRFRRPAPSDQPPRFRTMVHFVHALDGEFTFDDHGVPWGVVARNLNVSVVRAENLGRYVGAARFEGGTVRIQDFLPMWADMRTEFTLDGSRVDLHRILLTTDGAVSRVRGEVDFGNWPEQTYHVNSTVNFPRMREIFFASESWRLSGEGQFQGVFHLFKGGRSLTGDFTSAEAGVNDLRFPNLRGSLEWLPDRFRVTRAESDLYGGRTSFTYGLSPLGTPRGATATFTADYTDVSVQRFLQVFDFEGLEPAGRATGQLALTWPNGRFGSGLQGSGRSTITPPAGVRLAPRDLPAEAEPVAPEPAPFEPRRPLGPLGFGAELRYRFEPDRLVFEPGWTATPTTFVAFSGETAYGDRSRIPFTVTSLDWQASDRLLVAIMTAFGAPTDAVEVGGLGTFAGLMTGSFRAPRIEGRFESRAMRAWDVTWGRARGDIVIENSYLDIAGGLVGDPDGAHIRADGRFSLGYPRRDGGEEMRARVRVTGWPLAEIRHAFDQDDWPVDGTVALADLTLHGPYEGLFGGGDLRIDRGAAWEESFETATGGLEFDGTGVWVRQIELAKSSGRITGTAWIGWDGRYSFEAEGTRVPVQSLDNFRSDVAPLTGLLRFRTRGAGTFEMPAYDFDGSVADLSIGDEGVGQVTGRFAVRGDVLTISQLDATSSRIQLNGAGTIRLTDDTDVDLRFRFLETSVDPYLKFALPDFSPSVSPFTRLIVSGTLRLAGPMADLPRLLVDTTVEDATITLFDYTLTNSGPVRLRLDRHRIDLGRFTLQGLDTNLELSGGIDLGASRVDVGAAGQANLAIMQLFFRDLGTSGAATLSARIDGSVEEPRLTGEARITNGRIRHFGLPHALTAINGRIGLEPGSVTLGGLRARMGDGDVTFGGSIRLRGFVPEEYDVTARGSAMRLRYPEGFSSTVDADLALRGPIAVPRLSGSVDVLGLSYSPQIDENSGLFGLAAAGGGGAAGTLPVSPAEPTEPGLPLTFDVGIQMPTMPVIRNRTATIEASASLHFTGTLDRPVLTGRVDIDGGEVLFLGNRYFVRRGSIDFTSGTALEPVFDVEAETRVRAAGQIFNIGTRITGTFQKLSFAPTSDPWLPENDIIVLLLGGTPDVGTVEERALRSPQESQARMVQTAGAVLLTSPIASRVGGVFTDAFPIDTVQITPLLGNEGSLQQLNPSARITLGQRLSSRVFLTYSRSLSAAADEIILLEFDQDERVSWILSRNEDRTFALDFRLRYVF